MMMRQAATVALALFCGQGALAQDGEDNLRAALDVLPAGVFTATGYEMVRYLDLSRLAALNGGELDRKAFQRGQTGGGLRPVDSLAMAGPEEWAAKAGVAAEALRFVAGHGQPPHEVAIWGLADEATATAAFEALPARGFTPAGMPGVLANGEPGAANMALRDPADPWRGMLGQTSVVTRSGPVLLHSTDVAAFAPILGATAPIGTTTTGQTLLAGLEAQPGEVVQAMIFGPALGLHSGIDPAALMTATPEEARAALEAGAAPGVPLYSGAILADLQGPDGPVLVLALAYGDCATAEKAAARAAALWPQSLKGAIGGEARPAHTDAGEAGCAALITVASPGETNASYGRAVGAMMQRDLAPIRIGLE